MPINNTDLFKQQAFIANQWLDAYSQRKVTVFNPADNSVLGTVPDMGSEETELAINEANKAFQQWRTTTADERFNVLMKWYQLVLQNQQDLATLMTLEQGKPLVETLGEIVYAASFISWFAEQGKRITGRNMNHYSRKADIHYTREPVGVVGVITPWNFPSAMITRKIAPAIAAGCSVVIKPSEITPYSALALAELAKQAGFPAGLINVVTTSNADEVGKAICYSPLVRKISFTGSTKVGKILMQQSATTVKRTSMELGGNAPLIVFEDADLDLAVSEIILGKFRNAGQTCVCPNRIFVHQDVEQEFTQKLIEKVSEFKLGSGLEEGVTMGPLINQAAVAKANKHVKKAVEDGAEIILGGKLHELGGQFFEPTILKNVNANSIFCCEETFAPIAPLTTFTDEEKVIKLANDTEFGLAAYFFTQDFRRIRRVNNRLEAGMVGINIGIFSNMYGPFGGVKQSGVGRESSELGIEEYLQVKYSLISYE